MDKLDFHLDEAIPILERTPSVLSKLLDDLPEDWTRVNEGPDTWSPREVVAHLINGERTDWIPRARIILQQGKYRRFDPFDRFAGLDTQRPLTDLLDEFDKLRAENVATLRGARSVARRADHADDGARLHPGGRAVDGLLSGVTARSSAMILRRR